MLMNTEANDCSVSVLLFTLITSEGAAHVYIGRKALTSSDKLAAVKAANEKTRKVCSECCVLMKWL